jgi:hypothetical protein
MCDPACPQVCLKERCDLKNLVEVGRFLNLTMRRANPAGTSIVREVTNADYGRANSVTSLEQGRKKFFISIFNVTAYRIATKVRDLDHTC